ncbi:4Fe-4S binding protein [Stutzerimonas zhaodongensis]|uniref:4Fe-4S binding protein n=1 Tax=Stutzerimonas zhaodongensis TaxID=1176257 RepID=A0A3M2HSP4_9GAMM|nr:4Fe-4S binding protein [Stutzerimonas zhaodongensis]MCQ4315003.1 4Fe-4S binding protein [Stutzerimonas zhaodongensis]RMH90409.1 4Fe-4S binding protein [Stutzerimonas zhaodongensis]
MMAASPWLERAGDLLRQHARTIRLIQWLVVGFYLVLLLVPAVLSLPPSEARMLDNITVFAQFLFWGLWWPFVLLSMVLFGRLWCGVLCPEGSLSEWISWRGLNKRTPQWIRWSGWPTIAFVLTTVYGQLISVYDYGRAAALILGGSTVAAMIVGFLYGRGKRVWCRHLCPVSGVFGLLARLAPMHYKVDEARWQANQGPKLATPNCAPLIDIRRMQGNSECHACGRCSGQRGAVALAARSPNQEILIVGDKPQHDHWDSTLLLFGMIGLAMGAFQWTVSPWFITLKQTAAEWLVDRDIFWPLEANAPWWLLTHYPQANDAFTWLDGAAILTYIGASSLVIGGALWLLLRGAVGLMNRGDNVFQHLALALIPLGGAGLFLGLSATTIKLLRYEGFILAWVQPTRALLLAGAIAWSLYLAWRVISRHGANGLRRLAAFGCVGVATAVVGYGWYLQFWGWS